MSPSFKTIPLCFSLSLISSLFQTQDTLLALSVIASTIENPPPLMFVSLQSPPPSFCKRTPPFRKNPLTSKSLMFPVFLSKPLPAPMYTIPLVRHPHPPPWASHALGHLSMQLPHGRKGVPLILKMNGKNLPGWSKTNGKNHWSFKGFTNMPIFGRIHECKEHKH